MTAQGKITVANMKPGTRILVTTDPDKAMSYRRPAGAALFLSRVKRGAIVATVESVTGWVNTDKGSLSLAAHQTAWLAPEGQGDQGAEKVAQEPVQRAEEPVSEREPEPVRRASGSIHIGTFRESCESHGCPGCPAPAPAPAAIEVGNVITFPGGKRRFEVIEVCTLDRMAKVAPLDPEDLRDPFWCGTGSMTVVPPVADVTTVQVGLEARESREVFQVIGPEWSACWTRYRQFVIGSSGQRAYLLSALPGTDPSAAIKVRVGDTIRADGVTWLVESEDGREPTLRQVSDELPGYDPEDRYEVNRARWEANHEVS